MIYTKDLQLIANGFEKMVFAHPDDNRKIIKIMRPQRADSRGEIKRKHGIQKIIALQTDFGIYRPFKREALQYLRLCKSFWGQNRYAFPVENFYGFMPTELGLGMVCERIVSPSGHSETLKDICANSTLADKHVSALKNFFNDCRDMHIVFNDFSADNIMYSEERNETGEFVLIDGIGDRTLIPIRTLFKSFNAYKINLAESKLLSQLNVKI